MQRMKERLESGLSVVITLAVVSVAAVVVRRELVSANQQRTDAATRQTRSPVYVEKWQSMVEDGVEMGNSNALIRIIEFADLECPFCARFHETTLREVQREHGTAVGVTFMHLPLRIHRFAEPAAKAAECAAAQGRFVEFVDGTFAKQDSLGIKSWLAYARDALVADSAQFMDCLAAPLPARIEAGKRWAKDLNVTATPTIIVNGWRLAHPPDAEEFSGIIRRIQAGEAPFQPNGMQ